MSDKKIRETRRDLSFGEISVEKERGGDKFHPPDIFLKKSLKIGSH